MSLLSRWSFFWALCRSSSWFLLLHLVRLIATSLFSSPHHVRSEMHELFTTFFWPTRIPQVTLDFRERAKLTARARSPQPSTLSIKATSGMATITERPGVPSYREKPLRIATVQYDAKVGQNQRGKTSSGERELTELTHPVGHTAQGRSEEHRQSRGDAQGVSNTTSSCCH